MSVCNLVQLDYVSVLTCHTNKGNIHQNCNSDLIMLDHYLCNEFSLY